MASAGAARFRDRQRQIERVRNEIRLQRPFVLFLASSKVIGLAGKPAFEIVPVIENEIDVLVEIDHDRRIRHRYVARRRLSRTVEMLMPAIERNAEDRSCFPLEGYTLASVVPHGSRAPAVEHEHHFLKHL